MGEGKQFKWEKENNSNGSILLTSKEDSVI